MKRPTDKRRIRHLGIPVGAALLLSLATPALATPVYQLTSTIAIPVDPTYNPGGTFVGYDLSTFDPSTQLYYLTDRSNNAIDVFSAKTDSFVERIGSGTFTGNTPSTDNAGPNGISISNVAGGKLLLAGNGTSNFESFNLASNGLTVTGSRTVSTAVPGTPTPPNRVDGVAFAPTTNTILADNNASTPGFVTLVNNANGAIIKTILLNGTNGYPNVAGAGVEGTIFDPARGTFFVALPQVGDTGPGGVIELNAADGSLVKYYDFGALGLSGECGPTGIALSNSGNILVGCGDNTTPASNTVVLNPTTGLIKVTTGASGSDGVAYDPTTDTFFQADRFNPSGPVLGVFDGNGNFLQALPAGYNDHSVAVDPISGQVFVAFTASAGTNVDPFCSAGCIGVYTDVPEPSSLFLLFTGLICAAFAIGRVRTRMA